MDTEFEMHAGEVSYVLHWVAGRPPGNAEYSRREFWAGWSGLEVGPCTGTHMVLIVAAFAVRQVRMRRALDDLRRLCGGSAAAKVLEAPPSTTFPDDQAKHYLAETIVLDLEPLSQLNAFELAQIVETCASLVAHADAVPLWQVCARWENEVVRR